MKRILCLMLALFCILPIVACGNTNPPLDADGTTTATPDDTDSVTTDANGSVFDPEDSDVTTVPSTPTLPNPDDLFKNDPPLDLGGYTYRGYVPMMQNVPYIEDFWAETASSDVLTYAVYTRNKAIEETYNCRIRQYDATSKNQYDEMTRFYFNDETYELAILTGYNAAVSSTVNLLQNVYTLDNIKLEHQAYDYNSVEHFTMNGALYYLSGDMNISPLDTAAITIFNPDLFANYDFATLCGNEAYDDLYKMVADGTWTISAMLEMAEVVNADTDKNGMLLAADGDTVGYYSYSATPMYYWYGCGARISDIDPETGYPTLIFGAEDSNSQELFDFLFDSINNKVSKQWMTNGGGGFRNGEFMTNRLLFTDIILWDVRKVLYPQTKARYGILPTPKYNVAQDRYYDLIYWPYGTTHLWSIPTVCADREKASFMFHLMAVYSNAPDGTMNAFFEKTLCKKVAFDGGSRQTLRTIRDSLAYDIFLLYNWGGFIQSLIEGLDTADKNLYEETVTEDNISKAIADMNLTLERFKHPIEPQIEDAA